MGWLRRRRAQESPDEAVRSLVTHLSSGHPLVPMTPTMVTRQGETQYADLVVGAHAYYGTNVEYSSGYAVQGGPLFMAFGVLTGELHHARTRRQAERMAEMQWRWEGEIRVVLTDHRLVGFFGSGAEVYWWEHLLALTPAPDGRAVHLTFNGGAPLLFSGAWAPWLCAVTAALVHRAPWPPGHPLPAFAAPVPEPAPPPTASASARPALSPAPHREPAQVPQVSVVERLAEEVDPLLPEQAAEVLAGHPVTTTEQVLDLLGTRRAREIRAALQRRREG
ncbi:hypothetical protein [Streptomyces avidinii]|uniref:Uncharacterized protein n=1 Tax=Streptomyces avidinii TaxID=1895 RepID=A0ABS4KYT9_STRAV|nr:hypothetical protein [Streptomyces avidinii]MBP2035208.1 hypothetical protein [Streptomyces avidinii]GGZ04109.1 hypothetical protein GCM10010343_32500 [Streptomyces avidinii]